MTRQISPLRQRMIDDMTIRNMSVNTQRAYIRVVKKLQPPLRQVAGPAHVRARARVSAASGRTRTASRDHRQSSHAAC